MGYLVQIAYLYILGELPSRGLPLIEESFADFALSFHKACRNSILSQFNPSKLVPESSDYISELHRQTYSRDVLNVCSRDLTTLEPGPCCELLWMKVDCTRKSCS